MTTAIYLRVSTEEQRERQSIATQRTEVVRYCEAHKINEPAVYADDGISGTVPFEQRPDGARLLQDARDGKIGKVLIYKLDRLGRDTRVILNTIKQLEDLGVEIAATSEPYDSATPAGRFMTTIMAGQATLERENIRDRCVAGINRLVREGAWVGGIVPYGYRVEGQRRDARLVISDAPVPGTGMTESDVVRLIFQMVGDEGRSCVSVAEHLNKIGVPSAYSRDACRVKRVRAISGRWRGCRIQHIIKSTTYRGVLVYGKHPNCARRGHNLIERPVPAIVDEALWERAQTTLKRNLKFSPRNAKRQYLLRGLMRCAHCGWTYVGIGSCDKRMYMCGSRAQGKKAFPNREDRCRAKQISGDIEEIVWRDIEGFLRNPGPVLEELVRKIVMVELGSASIPSRIAALMATLNGKDEEQDRVVALFRRGRIDERTLGRQLDEIELERKGLAEEIERLETAGARARDTEAQLRNVGDLLRGLGQRPDQPLTWELKRRLVESLVEGIRIETVGAGAERDSHVTVTYRFSVPDGSIANHTPERVEHGKHDSRGAGAGQRIPCQRRWSREAREVQFPAVGDQTQTVDMIRNLDPGVSADHGQAIASGIHDERRLLAGTGARQPRRPSTSLVARDRAWRDR